MSKQQTGDNGREAEGRREKQPAPTASDGGQAGRAGLSVPALVVSCFLGSGKTTLVRHLLCGAQDQGLRVAVVSNEFGELGIDQALLGDSEQAYVELEGGCVCCKLGDELLETLQDLYEKVRPDRVIVETSGVAMPFDTLINFWREPVCRWSEDEVSVVVVNAEQVAAGRDLDGTFEDQVCSADILVLNKLDLVRPSSIDGIESLLREIEADAPILRCMQSRVPEELLFPPDPAGTRRLRRGNITPRPHNHDAYVSQELSVEPGIEAPALTARLQALNALRIKGFVETVEGLRLVQGVGRRIELSLPNCRPPDELLGRIVVISKAG